jgi:hypothetical protein
MKRAAGGVAKCSVGAVVKHAVGAVVKHAAGAVAKHAAGAVAKHAAGAVAKHAVRIAALLAVTCVAIYLPFRPEWKHYRQDVPGSHTRTVAPGHPAVFQRIRWTLLSYGRATLKPGDLPADGIGSPRRPGETLVLATLRAEPLTKNPDDLDIDYTLRDHAGHTWSAFPWHTSIYPGNTEPAQIMGLVPEWALGSFELVMRHRHRDLSPALGGPELVFLRRPSA